MFFAFFNSFSLSSIPSDDEVMYLGTYHIKNNGANDGIADEDLNVIKAWKAGYTGKNVHISMFDGGCLTTHQEFTDKFYLNRSWNEIDHIQSPITENGDIYHGTSTSSLAQGAYNNEGIVGVAYNSTFSMIVVDPRWESEGTIDFPLLIELYGKTEYDIRSMSLGMGGILKDGKIHMAQYRDFEEIETFFNNSMSRRNGLGAIYCHADGNSGSYGEDTNANLFAGVRQVMLFGGSTRRGQPLWYSQIGANVFANTPSGGTPYESGELYYPFIFAATPYANDSYGQFTGTSASAPQGAGVVALLLEANPKLTWRDVQYVLCLSATINDPKNPDWIENAAGYLYHPVLGFGRLDAGLAVQLASTWKNVDSEQYVYSDTIYYKGHKTSKKEFDMHYIFDKFDEIEIEVGGDVEFTEFVTFKFGIMRRSTAYLHIIVKSPAGTEFTLLQPSSTVNSPEKLYLDPDHLRLSARCFFGEDPRGKWTFRFKSQAYYPGDKLLHPSIHIYGLGKKPDLPSVEKRKAAIYTALEDPGNSTRPDESIEVSNAKCGEKMHIKLTTKRSYSDSQPMPLLLFRDNLTFDLPPLKSAQYSETNPKIIDVDTPCVFENNAEFILSARYVNQTDGVEDFISTHVTIQNDKTPQQLLKPQPYDIVKVSDGLTLQWTRHDKNMKGLGYHEMVTVDVFDIDKKVTVANSYQLHAPDSGNLHIDLDDECIHCVVTVIPVDNVKSDPCAAYIAPFSAVKNNTTVKKFKLNLVNKYCPIPKGILTNKLSTLDIVLISIGSFLFVVLVIIIVICIIKKKSKSKTNNTITESLNSV